MLNKICKILKLTCFSVFILLFTIFIFNNTDIITINLWPFKKQVSIRIFLLIIFIFILGMLFSMLLNLIKENFGIKKIKEEYRLKNIEKELNNLKNKYENTNNTKN